MAFRVLALFCYLLSVLICIVHSKKIAVIGGGISGTFVTKYLADYDANCELESITIFEPSPITKPILKNEHSAGAHDTHQTSRVSTLQVDDGAIVELGASILYKGFYLVSEMIRQGGLNITEPFSTGTDDEAGLNNGIGIYNGNGTWALLTSTVPQVLRRLLILFRYNTDLLRLTRICQQVLSKFATVPALLKSTNSDTFFESPDDIWEALGLSNAVHASFDRLLDVIGLSNHTSWRLKYLPYQGSLRSELLTAVNYVNYNQDNSQVNGIVGLGSFAAFSGGLFSVHGGNYQIIQSAYEQAVARRDEHCVRKGTVSRVEKRVTAVVGSIEELTLFSDEEQIGSYDIVILAAPLQQAQIQFLVPSTFDRALLHPMPLAGLVDAHETEIPDEGHLLLPENVHDSAMRPYTKVVTTVISNATINAEDWNMGNAPPLRSILFTKSGKAKTGNITGITRLSESGLYKVFSNDPLDEQVVRHIFGGHSVVEYTKVWGGQHGGATPDYQGHGTTSKFLLYDGATGFSGVTKSGALYYPVAMEQSSLASMEIAAIGAKAVAKLVARRIGLLPEKKEREARDEL